MKKIAIAFSVVLIALIGGWLWLTQPPYPDAPRRSPVAKAEQIAERALTPRARDYQGLPVCASDATVFSRNCLPPHLANLPPDPGEAGKKTLEGIDADGDGVRDDIQIYIAENYGYSERAVAALRLIAKAKQTELIGNPTKQEALALTGESDKASRCYDLTVDEKTKSQDAIFDVISQMLNSEERLGKYLEFDLLLANQVIPMPQGSPIELCGYDPQSLKN